MRQTKKMFCFAQQSLRRIEKRRLPPALGLSKFSANQSVRGDSNRSYPVLFLHGAWEDASSWTESAIYFADRGHTAATLEFSGFLGDSYKEDAGVSLLTNELHEAINQLGPLTIVVAPCLGGFIAQKYLESWGIAGLVLINPFPPDSSNLLRRIADVGPDEPFDTKALLKFGHTGILQSLVDKPRLTVAPEKLFSISATDESLNELLRKLRAPSVDLILDIFQHPVKRKRQGIPTLVFQSSQDHIITEEDMGLTLSFHDTDRLVALNDASHLFVLNSSNARRQLHEEIETWFRSRFY
mmetsp:Transcript_10600/g.13828  ORF Transcript_10600/g.13828 Transcript_10600/m.13828 type:complete len:297 (+) Transcript_10600:243-1133(+)